MATTPDDSSYGHTVNLTGVATVSTPAVWDKALQVTRTGPNGSVNDGAQLVEKTSELQPGSSDYTIELRVRMSTVHGAQHICGRGDVTDMVLLGALNSGPWFYVQTAGVARVNLNPYGAYPFAANTWYALCIERYGTTHTLYVDGAIAATTAAWNGTVPTLAGEWCVGYTEGCAAWRYNVSGAIDEFKYSGIARYEATAYTIETDPFET